MRVCGVELKGSEAIICILGYSDGAFEVPDCRQRQFAVPDSVETEAMRKFQFAFSKLMEDYKIDEVVILKREPKGKFAGTATSFKLEAAIQMLEMPVHIISHADIKVQMKEARPMVEFNDIGLKKFQQPAFNVAYTLQVRKFGE